MACACNFVFLPFVMEEAAKDYAEKTKAECRDIQKGLTRRGTGAVPTLDGRSYGVMGSIRDNVVKFQTLQFKFINFNEYDSNPGNEFNGIYNFVGRDNKPPGGLPVEAIGPWDAQVRGTC